MLYYIRKYPISLFIIVIVIYLSFFKPPTTDLSKIPNLDKVVHFCMYGGMSGMLWLEFLWIHQIGRASWRERGSFAVYRSVCALLL